MTTESLILEIRNIEKHQFEFLKTNISCVTWTDLNYGYGHGQELSQIRDDMTTN